MLPTSEKIPIYNHANMHGLAAGFWCRNIEWCELLYPPCPSMIFAAAQTAEVNHHRNNQNY